MFSSTHNNGSSRRGRNDDLSALMATTIALLSPEKDLSDKVYERAARDARRLLSAIPLEEPHRAQTAVAASVMHGLSLQQADEVIPNIKHSVKNGRNELQKLRRTQKSRPPAPVIPISGFFQSRPVISEKAAGALKHFRRFRAVPLPIGKAPAPLSCN